MKVVVFESEDWERPFFDRYTKNGHELVFEPQPLDEDTIASYRDAEIISPFVFSDCGADILAQMPDLKMIATRSTGFDHIDTDHCRAGHITVSNVPTYGENTVAEHVFALLLAISHKIPEAVNRTRQGDFSQKGLQGFDLCGRTLGVIGTGNIGLKTIRIARGFGMNVVAYDLNPDESAAAEMGFSYAALDDLLSQSDIITLHVPGNDKTHHMLGAPQFEKMKDGAVLINTARGNVVDVQALLHALADGKVAAAGLDVLPEEPTIREEAELLRHFFTRKHDLENLLADHILLHMKNVIITPHSAFNTKEAVQRILKTTTENIDGFLDEKPVNVVT